MRERTGDLESSLLTMLVHHMRFLRFNDKLRVCHALEKVENFRSLTRLRLQEIIRGKIPISFDVASIQAEFEQTLKIVEKKNIHWISCLSAHYPAELRHVYNPPFGLFVFGQMPKNFSMSLAIVGTRRSLRYMQTQTQNLAQGLSEAGIAIISGLAIGIDAAAHRGAAVGQGKTFAVMGNGINFIYPKRNIALANQIILNGGGLISEYPPNMPAHRYHFPERNRIIAGLSRGTLLMEAPIKSGALITVRQALEAGRDIFVYSHTVQGSEHFAGNEFLLEEGALPVERINDVLSLWDLPLDYRNLEKPHKPFSEAQKTPAMGLVKRLEQELEDPSDELGIEDLTDNLDEFNLGKFTLGDDLD